MPPKPKFSRDEIIEAALNIVAQKGVDALTARELGTALGSSPRPIFTIFANMDELNAEVRNAAMRRFEEYAQKAEEFTPIFKQMGLQMVLFAVEEPRLFRLLYMMQNEEARSFDDIFDSLGETAVQCMDVIQKDYGLDYNDAMLLFKHTWIYTYGICVMCASGMCCMDENEISDMLSREFVGMLTLIKSGRARNCTTVPEHK